MILLSMATLLASCACCPSFEPVAPHTTRDVQSGWGEAIHGVSTLFTTDADTVDMGDVVQVELFFHFWPFLSDGPARTLADSPGIRPRLVLVPVQDGGALTRSPYRTGMPMSPDPSSHVDLRAGQFHSRSESFPLLSRSGQQVPAGDYLVRVEYENEGADSRPYRTEDGRVDHEPYAAGSVWTGRVETAALSMHIRSREPERLPCELPKRVDITTFRNGQLMWSWDPAGFEPDTLTVRPGFIVGLRTECRKYRNSGLVEAPDSRTADDTVVRRFRETYGASWSRSLGGLPRPDRPGSGGLTGPKIAEIVSDADPLEARFVVTVFETSVPGGHRWSPERGDYRILREYEVRAYWPNGP